MAWPSQRPLATPRPDSAWTTVVSMASPKKEGAARDDLDSALIVHWHHDVQVVFFHASACFPTCASHTNFCGVPRGFKRLTREQVDLCWPNTSNRAPHLQNRPSTWRGKCKRTRSNVRNSSFVYDRLSDGTRENDGEALLRKSVRMERASLQ